MQFLLMCSEGKIPPEEPAVLLPLPLIPKNEKRKITFGTPQSSRRPDYRDWDRERDRDFELMPPPGSHRKDFAAHADVDQPIDPDEPTYCVCHQVLTFLLQATVYFRTYYSLESSGLYRPLTNWHSYGYAGVIWRYDCL